MQDIVKLKPLMSVVTIRDDHGQLLWKQTPTQQFTVKFLSTFLNDLGISTLPYTKYETYRYPQKYISSSGCSYLKKYKLQITYNVKGGPQL
jgi:hypothetical protein